VHRGCPGGRFLQARDAASLKDALSVAVAESIVVCPSRAATSFVVHAGDLKVPPSVVAGAVFPSNGPGPTTLET